MGQHSIIKKLQLIPQFKQKSQDWLDQRKLYLTSSDAATAIGINPYSKPEELLFKKCGVSIPFTGNIATRHGEKYEDEAIEKYCSALGMKNYEFGLIPYAKVSRDNPNDSYNFLAGSPDGLAVPINETEDEEPILIEVKCPFRRKPKQGFCPVHYYPQVQLNMLICGVKRADFIEYLPFAEGNKLFITRYEIDNDYLSKILKTLIPFWRSVVDYRDNIGIRNHTNYTKWINKVNKAIEKSRVDEEKSKKEEEYILDSDSD